MPAIPSATSVVPWRKGRPNESLTITPTSRPVRSQQAVADPRRRRVRIEREQHERPLPLRVRRVDAGRRADEAVPRLGDHERRPRADHPDALAQDRLDVARIAFAGELARALGRLDLVEA